MIKNTFSILLSDRSVFTSVAHAKVISSQTFCYNLPQLIKTIFLFSMHQYRCWYQWCTLRCIKVFKTNTGWLSVSICVFDFCYSFSTSTQILNYVQKLFNKLWLSFAHIVTTIIIICLYLIKVSKYCLLSSLLNNQLQISQATVIFSL